MRDWGYEDFDEDELGNGDPKCPVVLLLDTSESMGWDRKDPQGHPLRRGIEELNDGLSALSEALRADSVARRRVEIQVVTFGGSVTAQGGFTAASSWRPSPLGAAGNTPMQEALERGLDLATTRRRELQRAGTVVYCPWIFLMTDGKPSTALNKEIVARIARAEESKRAVLWAIGSQDADVSVLRSVSTRPVLRFDERDWSSLFIWISAAVSRVAGSRVGEQVSLEPWSITA